MKPWMSQQEIDTILKYLKPNFTMLEWGCGGSTMLFPKYVANYYSIEHNKDWYDKMLQDVPKNVTLNFVAMNSHSSPNQRSTSYETLEKSSRSKDFYNYIHYPSNLNKVFDIVLVDGRARPECAKYITNYITKDSIVFVHDYFPKPRTHYRVLEEKYKIIDSIKTGQTLAVLQLK